MAVSGVCVCTLPTRQMDPSRYRKVPLLQWWCASKMNEREISETKEAAAFHCAWFTKLNEKKMRLVFSHLPQIMASQGFPSLTFCMLPSLCMCVQYIKFHRMKYKRDWQQWKPRRGRRDACFGHLHGASSGSFMPCVSALLHTRTHSAALDGGRATLRHHFTKKIWDLSGSRPRLPGPT